MEILMRMKPKLTKALCKLGIHKWHKSRFPSGARIQTYAHKKCLYCDAMGRGYAKMNHPFFWKVLGKYSDN